MGICSSAPSSTTKSYDLDELEDRVAEDRIRTLPIRPDVPNDHGRTTNATFQPSTKMLAPSEPPFIDNVWKIYHKDEVLGEGSFGKVYAVTKLDNDHRYALKKMPHSNPEDAERFRREAAILSELNHPNIIKLNRTWRDSNHYYILSKLCEGGELMQRVKSEQYLSEKFAAEIMQTVVTTVAYAHSLGVVHQDLKPENIVFDTTAPDSPVIVIDWGEARFVTDYEEINARSGTRAYLAPETGRTRKGWEVKKSDMWSIGVIAYILLTGRRPFQGTTKEQIEYNAKHQHIEFPRDLPLSDECKDFVYKCLRRKVELRCSAEEALALPWLLRASAQSDENIVGLISEDLTALTNASKLQRLVLNVAVQNMEAKEKKELKMVFERIDLNGDGRVDVNELAQHFQEQVPTLKSTEAFERAEMMIQCVGSKKNTSLGLKEFAKAHVAHQLFSKDGLADVFRRMTHHHSSISLGGFEQAFEDSVRRDLTEREKDTLSREFSKHFGEQDTISEEDFIKTLRLRSEADEKADLVENLFEISDSSKSEEFVGKNEGIN